MSAVSLFNGSVLPGLLLHIPAVLVWAVGIHLSRGKKGREQSLVALLLGLVTFPAVGTLVQSLTELVGRGLPSKAVQDPLDWSEMYLERERSTSALLSRDWIIQPLVDLLEDGELESRRTAVANLGRCGTPEAIGLLREHLSDAQAEIRHDVALVLARLEDSLSSDLTAALARWMEDRTDRQAMVDLADEYSRSAMSHMLDKASHRLYLQKASDLLGQVLMQEQENISLLMRLARVQQALGELVQASASVQRALQLQPHLPEAVLLAMELAFQMHSWDRFLTCASQEAHLFAQSAQLPRSVQSLEWWPLVQMRPLREARHGG